ncbi:ATP-dependent DNA helicase [Blautia sp. 2744]|uniref:ATP-dependent DNA helicase n=1 Tax=Blautia intestinalis TaxID=2763028 RepID=A0ABR7I3Y5_9FIRM|nr:ATP-dependent DNA helicase [Blautia intestinalis]MBC5741230.1 ATP-dependent DNA helicase [Blautia intestinalis]RHD31347.1 ATP-dependent DNA helicase [Blautia obeum]
MEKPIVRISVRNLVEFILRNGDLVNGSSASDKEAMLKGSRLHRKIQKQMGSHYQPEVSLKKDTEYDDLILRVEGRADGIFSQDDRFCIDEIKGVYKNLELMEEPVPVHRAQALCYAWIYLDEHELEEIDVQMTYVHLDTEVIKRFRETLTRAELRQWYKELTDSYHRWLAYQIEWRKKRNESMENLDFPFTYRKGQREMVSGIYHAISKKEQIFIQAPTGVGKTMSAVFPAVRAIGQGMAETVFYLTARTITRTVAQDAFEILRDRGLLFKVVTITAKEKLCFCDKPECDPEKCPYAKGHYDRINDAVYELWTTEQSFDRETLLRHAQKRQVCPFEMSLDLAIWMDGVICDYNYVFDPNVCLKRFFGENVSGNYLFLIDEAHNLVDRGREMYSASICLDDVIETRKSVKPYSQKLWKKLGKVKKQMEELKQNCSEWKVQENAGVLPVSLLSVQGELDQLLEEPPSQELVDGILDFYFEVRDFLNISELVDDNYVVYTAFGEDGRFYEKLFCVNPAENLQKCLDKGNSTVFFSATLLPLQYYRKMLSTRSENFGMYVESPFEQSKRLLMICRDVSSKYTRRGYEEYHKIAEYIARMSWQKKGNYMVFFPSYRLMEDVYQVYQDEFSVSWVRCISQHASMTELEREEFLNEFTEESEETLVGFCVMGGIFSEGIDLIGDRLIGTAVVGTGLPQVSCEREILKDYYDEKGEQGFDYAYRYPGMNKVLQAAGRVIRTKEDTGTILLLDERFLNRDYRNLFPGEWSNAGTCTLGNVEKYLQAFWNTFEDK